MNLMKNFDGMEGVIEIKSKRTLAICTKYPTLRNLWGYRQLGVYAGDTTGIEETDRVKIYFKHPKTLKGKLHILIFKINIERVELISPGLRPKGFAQIKYTLLGK